MNSTFLLAYFRMVAYTLVITVSFFSYIWGVESVRRIFIANAIFSIFLLLSVSHFAIFGNDLEKAVNYFVTTGAFTWAIIHYINFIRRK